jgi:single-strand DNA-binding protein
MLDNVMHLAGNVATIPDLRYTPGGVAVCSFRLAQTTRQQTASGWANGPTTFLTVVTWRALADHVARSIDKGDRVMVLGRLRQHDWQTPEGDKRTQYELEASDVGLSLRYAIGNLELGPQVDEDQAEAEAQGWIGGPHATVAEAVAEPLADVDRRADDAEESDPLATVAEVAAESPAEAARAAQARRQRPPGNSGSA